VLVAAAGVGSNPVIAFAIVLLIVAVTLPIASRTARREGETRLFGIQMAGLAIHLVATILLIFVVDHVYHGITDYTKYLQQGATLASNFDHGHLSLAGTRLTSPFGPGGVSIAAGIVFAVIGVNKLAGFFVFSWFAFLGSIAFYRAFSITFPDAPKLRYARLVFFLPSLWFWTAGISKESVMYLSLGVAAMGASSVLAHRRGGYLILALGIALGVWVRPHELVLLVGALAGATLLRRRDRQALGGLRRVVGLAGQAGFLVVTVVATKALLKHSGVTTGSFSFSSLSGVSAKNVAIGSSVPYSANPLAYPRDLYAVLFDPLPFNAHGATQFLAAGENTIILVLILLSLRRLRMVIRVARARPYVGLCLLYCIAFAYLFAALSNLGLIDRERVLMLPFLLVILAIPISPKDGPARYPWELRRRERREYEQWDQEELEPGPASQDWSMRTSQSW